MSKHTPGPWEIEPLEVFGRGDREGTAHIVLWDEDREGYTFVARALSFYDDESVANARLIAAAPTMLQDLIDAAAQLRKYETLHRAKGHLEKADVNAALAARFEATIAAAVGGAPTQCCKPTAEEEALLASGEYRPEELWGGSRPTCPQCFKG